MSTLVIDGTLLNREEWGTMLLHEQLWVLASLAVDRGLPADFMPPVGDDLVRWVATHIGLPAHDGRSFTVLFMLTLRMGEIMAGRTAPWKPGARLPAAPEPAPNAPLRGFASAITGALRSICETPEASAGAHPASRRRPRALRAASSTNSSRRAA